MKSKEILLLAGCLTVAALLFALNIGGYDLWPPDEPRYAQVAREMMQSGDYIAPRVNNQPYKEKPPLMFWLIAACSYGQGDVAEWSARLPSVLSGIVAALFCFLLGRSLFDVKTALWSVVILVTFQRFWWNARFGQIDMLVTACLTAGLWGFRYWETSSRKIGLVVFYIMAACGLLAKGPGVIVFPVLFLAAWGWRTKNQRTAFFVLIPACALSVLIYALWAVPAHIVFARETAAAATEALSANLIRQTIGRFFLGVSHANWPWYYLKTLPIDFLPWTLFLPWALVWAWRQRHELPEVRFLLCWIVPAFIFFSMAIGKRQVYLLPLYPAFAIIFAKAVLAFMQGEESPWKKRLTIIHGVLLIVIGLVPFGFFATPYKHLWTVSLGALSLLFVGYGVLQLVNARSGRVNSLHFHIPISASLLFIAVALVIFPKVNVYKSARRFCEPILRLSEQGVDFDLYSVGFAREEYIYYSKHFFKELYTDIIPLEHAHGMDEVDMVRFQRDVARTISKAVDKVPVRTIAAITPEELSALQQAMKKAIAEKKYDEVVIQDFLVGLERAADDFFKVFGSSRPAFLYVQENDWRWIYAIHPDVQEAVVLSQASVGSRDVVLVANPAGAALLIP